MAETKEQIAAERDELKARVAELEAKDADVGAVDTPHVVQAVSKVLAALSVEKNGQLPPNMGGKSYISAVDLNLEIKRRFVEHGLIIAPTERLVKEEIINDGGRKTIAITIEGTYTIISTKDSTQLTVGGVGDGLATGSAVASNIASTNALKNAMLRFFLVTEQSVEDAAKNGIDESSPSGQTGALGTAAKAGARGVPQPVAPRPESDLKATIRTEFIESGLYEPAQVNAVMDAVKADENFRGDKLLPEVYRRLKNGELA